LRFFRIGRNAGILYISIMKKIIHSSILTFFLSIYFISAQDPAARDLSFEMGIVGPIAFQGAPIQSRLLTRTLVLPGDKILVYGSFSTFSSVQSIARLYPDGNIDPTFICPLYGIVRKIMHLPDGKLLVGGGFMGSFSNPGLEDIVRLHPDGQLDTTFQQVSFTSDYPEVINPFVTDFDVDAEGRILLAGNFSSVNGESHRSLVRLMPDGSIDYTFDIGSGPSHEWGLTAVLVHSDGRILIGGHTTSWNGIDVGTTTVLLSNGSADTTFSYNHWIYNREWVFAKQPDGKVIRYRAQYNAQSNFYFSRLNVDLSQDTLFDPPSMEGLINSVTVQSDGKILISGVSINNTLGLLRLLPNGNLDTSLDVGEGFGELDYIRVISASLQSTGKIIVTHDASSYRGESLMVEENGSMWIDFVIRLDGEPSAPVFNDNVYFPDQLNIWPNPTEYAFFVETGTDYLGNNSFISISDMQGREVFRDYIIQSTQRIETTAWPSGIYIVYVEGVGVGKVVVGGR